LRILNFFYQLDVTLDITVISPLQAAQIRSSGAEAVAADPVGFYWLI
jgi:hypothetical protein